MESTNYADLARVLVQSDQHLMLFSQDDVVFGRIIWEIESRLKAGKPTDWLFFTSLYEQERKNLLDKCVNAFEHSKLSRKYPTKRRGSVQRPVEPLVNEGGYFPQD